MAPRRRHRMHMRVPIEAEVTCAWGYERQRCALVEYSPHGLTIQGLAAPLEMPVSVVLELPRGTFTTCGTVVHRSGPDGSVGVQLLPMPRSLQEDLELFLWELLAAASLPEDTSQCHVAGCNRPRKARGMCSRHYARWRRLRT